MARAAAAARAGARAARAMPLLLAVTLLAPRRAAGYYLPGTYPREFRRGDVVQGMRREKGKGGRRAH